MLRNALQTSATDHVPVLADEVRELLAADADGEVGRALAAALEVAHEALDDPVLERMERDDRETAARPQHRERCGERCLE